MSSRNDGIVIDVFARRLVGWKVWHAMRNDFVLDAFEPALHHLGDEMPGLVLTLVIVGCSICPRAPRSAWRTPASPRRSAVAAMRTIMRRRVRDWLYKTEVIGRRDRWQTLEAVEFATLRWVNWFNHRRLLGPIGTTAYFRFPTARVVELGVQVEM